MKKANYILTIVLLLLMQHIGVAQQYEGFDLGNTDAYSLKSRTAFFAYTQVESNKDNKEPGGEFSAEPVLIKNTVGSFACLPEKKYSSALINHQLLCFISSIHVRAPSCLY